MIRAYGLLFTVRRGPLPWLIRLFTRSKVSHVAIMIDVDGREFLLHSTHGGLRIDREEVWATRRGATPVERWLFTSELNERRLWSVLEQLGEAYDFTNLLGNALSIAVHHLTLGRIRLRNRFANPRLYVCSEVCLSLDPDGYVVREWDGLDPERTTAEDLRAICNRSRAFTQAPA